MLTKIFKLAVAGRFLAAVLVALAGFAFGGGGACAQETVLGEAGGKFDLGTELHYFKYEEPDVMEEEGFMYGVFGRYTYRVRQNDRVEHWSELFQSGNTINTFIAEGKFSFGQVDYESQGTGTIDGIDDYLTEVRALAGYDVSLGQASLFTPYVGFGFRYWMDSLGGETSTTGHLGYDRESQYFYLPLGATWALPVSGGWNLAFNAEYDLFLDGQQKSHLEDVHPSLSTLENDQNDGWGVRGAITISKAIDRFELVVEPFIRYWDIDESDLGTISCAGVPCALGYEPSNNTLETGARIGMKF